MAFFLRRLMVFWAHSRAARTTQPALCTLLLLLLLHVGLITRTAATATLSSKGGVDHDLSIDTLPITTPTTTSISNTLKSHNNNNNNSTAFGAPPITQLLGAQIGIIVAHVLVFGLLVLTLYALWGSRLVHRHVHWLLANVIVMNMLLPLGSLFLGGLQYTRFAFADSASHLDDDTFAEAELQIFEEQFWAYGVGMSVLLSGLTASSVAELAMMLVIRLNLERGQTIPSAGEVKATVGSSVGSLLATVIIYLIVFTSTCTPKTLYFTFSLTYIPFYYVFFGLLAVVGLPLIIMSEVTLRRIRRLVRQQQRTTEGVEGGLLRRVHRDFLDERRLQLLKSQERSVRELVLPLRGYPVNYIVTGVLFAGYRVLVATNFDNKWDSILVTYYATILIAVKPLAVAVLFFSSTDDACSALCRHRGSSSSRLPSCCGGNGDGESTARLSSILGGGGSNLGRTRRRVQFSDVLTESAVDAEYDGGGGEGDGGGGGGGGLGDESSSAAYVEMDDLENQTLLSE